VGAREGDRKSVGLGEDEVVRERCAVRETLALRLALRLDEPASVLETVTEALTLGERERERVSETVPRTARETLAVCAGLREELAERLALRETVAVAVTAADCVRDGETVRLALLLKDLLSEALRDMDLVSEAVMLNERLTEAVSEGELLSREARAAVERDALQERVRARFGLPKDAPPALRLAALWSALVDFVVDHADVLAAAEVEARSRAALAEQAPFYWRHHELARALRACGVDDTRASLLADAWLHGLAADVVRRALVRASIDDVRAAWRALPGGLDVARRA
jgi:hypothetical protein